MTLVFCVECGEEISEEDMWWTYGAPLCRTELCVKLREGDE
tara:strand:- start:1343 stop:1465 length:123 start_codon:yes stop_codon:yes gene_type:complete